MNEVIYLIEQPLSNWNYERFGIDTWINRGWKVKVWDLTKFINPLAYQYFSDSGMTVHLFEGYYEISNKSELQSMYKTINNGSYFVSAFGESAEHILVMRQMSQAGAKRIWSNLGSIPGVPSNTGINKFFKKINVMLRTSPKLLWKALRDKFYRKIYRNQVSPSLIVVAGRKSFPNFLKSNDVRLVLAHNLDYDNYLFLRDHNEKKNVGSLVFLDQNYCFSSEWLFPGLGGAPTSPDNYFPKLTKILNSISLDLDLATIVAGHPRFNYADIKKHYGKIIIECGKTAQLIRDCDLVVGHDSTAIQLAVIFQKPLIFLTSCELDLSVWGQSIRFMAAELGKYPINIDHPVNAINWQDEMYINIDAYNRYKENYIKISGSPEKSSWNIVIDRIEKNHFG
jgi:hypothetical protein